MRKIILGIILAVIGRRVMDEIKLQNEIRYRTAILQAQAQTMREHIEMMRLPMDKRADEERRTKRRWN